MKSNNLKITELEIPFPVIAIDDFMPTSLLRAASNSFPNLEEMQLGWTETRDAGALAFGSTDKFQNLIQHLFWYMA